MELRQKLSESKVNSRVNLARVYSQRGSDERFFRKCCARCRRAIPDRCSSIRERHAIWRVTQIKRVITGIKAPTPLAISSTGRSPLPLQMCTLRIATFFDRFTTHREIPGEIQFATFSANVLEFSVERVSYLAAIVRHFVKKRGKAQRFQKTLLTFWITQPPWETPN